MTKWNKELFVEDLRNSCSREIAKIGEKIIDFSEDFATDVSWGRGDEHGTFTFRCNSEVRSHPHFYMRSDGKLNSQINLCGEIDLTEQSIRFMIDN